MQFLFAPRIRKLTSGHLLMGEAEYNKTLRQVSDLEKSMRAFVSP